MSFESFYGGRMGASFVIVKQFDGINIPQDDPQHPTYKYDYLAATNDLEYYLYIDGNFIRKTGDNYHDYVWKPCLLDGRAVNVETPVEGGSPTHSIQNVPITVAQGMVQCFKQGGASTNTVNYGEYVIIDDIDKQNPDNGKVFRRGMNFDSELGGAEYIGQIIGPAGDSPEYTMDTVTNIQAMSGAVTKTYTVGNDSLVPGKSGDTYNDAITYAWANMIDEVGTVHKVAVGFKFPYLVIEFTAKQRSAYDNNGHILPADFELAERVDDGSHPFYSKWKINLPKGVKGDSLKDLEIVPKQAREGCIVYSDTALTIPTARVVDAQHPAYVDLENYDATLSYIALVNSEGYIKPQDAWKQVMRYKDYNYENEEDGEFIFVEIGGYNTISSIDLQEDGTLTINYTNTDPYVAQLKAITDVNINTGAVEGSGSQKVQIEYCGDGVYHEIGEPLNYVLDTYVVPFTGLTPEQLAYKGHLLVYYSDPERRTSIAAGPVANINFYSARFGSAVSGWND